MIKGNHCRVNLAGLGECAGTCQRCGAPFIPGQAVVLMAKGMWIRAKVGDLHDPQLYHAVCPGQDE